MITFLFPGMTNNKVVGDWEIDYEECGRELDSAYIYDQSPVPPSHSSGRYRLRWRKKNQEVTGAVILARR